MKQTIDAYRSNKLLNSFIDYFFWVLLILYTNPGSISQALNIWKVAGRVTINDLLFVLLSICYVIVPKTHNTYDLDFIKVKKILILFLAYYLLAFAYIIPLLNENSNYSLLITLIKSRWQVFNILLFMYIYEFFKRRWDIFLKLFLISSIIILLLFIQGIITKIEILPIEMANRGFVNINRYAMYSYGLMPLLIPLGIVSFIYKSNIRNRKIITIGFILMSIAYLVSLNRRDIIGIFILFLIAFIANAYINKRFMVLLNNVVKISLLLLFLLLLSYLAFPKYVDAARVGFEESVSVLLFNRTMEGKQDLRMTLDKPFINQQFYNHPVFGTGFDNRWRTGEGDKEGYEAADYPFLSALAMFGVVGVLIFIPVYIILIKSLKNDFEFLRTNSGIDQDMLFLIYISLILYFLFHLLQYFNYFWAISFLDDFTWYFFLSLYLAAKSEFYNFNFINNQPYIENLMLKVI